MAHLERLGITRLRVHPDPLKIATEGALWGSVVAHGLLKDAVIVSDDAGQFNVGSHALCWVHAERLIHKLVGFNHRQRQACARIRARVWWSYADLKAYCRDPTPRRKRELQARFDRLFTTTTGFAALDRLIARLHANKAELLRALERPDIPLHTNGSENRHPLPGDKAQNQRWHPLGDRPRLPRRLPRLDEDLRQARRLVLGLPREAGSTSPARHQSSPCQTSSASALPPDRPAFCPCYADGRRTGRPNNNSRRFTLTVPCKGYNRSHTGP